MLNVFALVADADLPLWIVTEGAQCSPVSAPRLAALWGLCRTARIELSDLQVGCLDTSADADAELVKWQLRQPPAAEPEVAILRRAAERLRWAPPPEVRAELVTAGHTEADLDALEAPDAPEGAAPAPSASAS